MGDKRHYNSGLTHDFSGLLEPEDMPLFGPARRQRFEASELAHCEVDGLPPFDECLDNLGCEEGKRQDTTDLAIIDTGLTREAREAGEGDDRSSSIGPQEREKDCNT